MKQGIRPLLRVGIFALPNLLASSANAKEPSHLLRGATSLGDVYKNACIRETPDDSSAKTCSPPPSTFKETKRLAERQRIPYFADQRFLAERLYKLYQPPHTPSDELIKLLDRLGYTKEVRDKINEIETKRKTLREAREEIRRYFRENGALFDNISLTLRRLGQLTTLPFDGGWDQDGFPFQISAEEVSHYVEEVLRQYPDRNFQTVTEEIVEGTNALLGLLYAGDDIWTKPVSPATDAGASTPAPSGSVTTLPPSSSGRRDKTVSIMTWMGIHPYYTLGIGGCGGGLLALTVGGIVLRSRKGRDTNKKPRTTSHLSGGERKELERQLAGAENETGNLRDRLKAANAEADKEKAELASQLAEARADVAKAKAECAGAITLPIMENPDRGKIEELERRLAEIEEVSENLRGQLKEAHEKAEQEQQEKTGLARQLAEAKTAADKVKAEVAAAKTLPMENPDRGKIEELERRLAEAEGAKKTLEEILRAKESQLPQQQAEPLPWPITANLAKRTGEKKTSEQLMTTVQHVLGTIEPTLYDRIRSNPGDVVQILLRRGDDGKKLLTQIDTLLADKVGDVKRLRPEMVYQVLDSILNNNRAFRPAIENAVSKGKSSGETEGIEREKVQLISEIAEEVYRRARKEGVTLKFNPALEKIELKKIMETILNGERWKDILDVDKDRLLMAAHTVEQDTARQGETFSIAGSFDFLFSGRLRLIS